MKFLLFILPILLLTSCGKVLSPEELLNPKQGLVDKDDFNELQDRVTILENKLVEAYSVLNDLNTLVDDSVINQDALETMITAQATSILNLENALNGLGYTVSSVIDPCGSNPGQYDEILLLMSNGDIVGYFETDHSSYNQGKRFLTVLKDGNYSTTDSQSCSFSIVNGQYQE